MTRQVLYKHATGPVGVTAPDKRIIAAAIRYGNLVCFMPPPARHGHILAAMNRMPPDPDDQGFLTSDGRFVTRAEAAIIATKAYQRLRVTGSKDELFTEDLW